MATTYIDVEPEDELAEEDAIVREAVNEIVETVRTELESEVSSLAQDVLNYTERLFPILVDYKREPFRIREDLEKLGLSLLLLIIAVWILGPSKQRRKKKTKYENNLKRRFWLKRSISSGRVTDDTNAFFFSSPSQTPSEEESESDRGAVLSFSEDETDEERFEKLWPSVIAGSRYRRLVLPPTCRYVGTKQRSTPTAASTKNSTNKDANQDHEDKNENRPDDDNPAGRIQNYLRQLWYFIRSLISYDFFGAGRTLMGWLQYLRRMHHRRRRNETDDNNTADDLNTVDGNSTVDTGSVDGTALATKGTEDEKETMPTVDEEGASHSVDDSSHHDDAASVDHKQHQQTPPSSPLHSVSHTIIDDSGLSVSPLQQTPMRDDGETERRRMDGHSPSLPFMSKKQLLRYGMKHHQDDDGDNDSKEVDPLESEGKSVDTKASRGDGEGDRGDTCDSVDNKKTKSLLPKVSLPRRTWLRKRHIPKSDDESSSRTSLQQKETAVEHDVTEEALSTTVAESPVSVASSVRQSVTADDTIQLHNTSLESLAAKSLLSIHERSFSEEDPLLSSTVVPDENPKAEGDPPALTRTSKSSLRHFFDTAGSRASLKKMSVDCTIPDKHGYILGDDFMPDGNRSSPLLVFVNSRSGPQQGQLLITQLRRLLNPIQVWDLSHGSPDPILESFLVLSRLRILVCGGDGTVSWIINVLERLHVPPKLWPPIAILPLGTGNDLARILGWGGGYNNESLIAILEQISESYVSLLDRWEVTIHDRKNKKEERKGFFNYLGVGADAQAALQVHYLRESRPQWFFSRLVNKAMYGIFGAEDIIKASNVSARKEIKLIADGVEVPLPPDSQGIILLNIDSYAGGVPLWTHGANINVPSLSVPRPKRSRSLSDFELQNAAGRFDLGDRIDSTDNLRDLMTAEEKFAHVTACDMPSSCQDGYLDVVSIRGAFHLGQIKVGLSNAQRICQCREATITIKNKVAVQVDGEPWRQRSSTLTIKRKKDPAVMLHRSADDGGVEMEMGKLLDWAEERKMIDSKVHSILMKEFSRRIESKTRQRRVRAQDNMLTTLKKVISSGAMANLNNQNMWQGDGGDGILF